MGLSEAIGELFILLRVKDETSSGLKQAEGNLGKTGKAAKDAGKEAEQMGTKFGKAVTAIAAAAAAAIAGIELVTSRAKGLNAGFDSIAASTGNERDALRGLASDLQNVTFGYDEILDTFQAIESHGVRNIATYRAVAQAADTLGAATRSSAAESADVILQIGDAFDLSAEQAIGAIDSIAVANRQYGADIRDISKLVGTYGDEFDDLGLSFDDLIASYVALRAEGRTHKDAMREIGEATRDAAGAEGVWADAMDDAASSQAALTSKIESGQEALAGIADRIAASTRAIADYDKEIAKQEQTVADLAAAITDAEASVDIFADAYSQVTAEAERFTDAIETEQETLDGLNASLQKAQQAHADLLDEYAATEQQIGRLEAAYEDAKNANDYFAEAYADAAGTLADATDAYEAHIETLGDLEDAYADLVGDQQKAAASLAELEAEYRDAATSTDWLDEATRDHAAEVERLEDRYDRLTSSVADYQDRIEDSRHETGNLERDLARERETLAELQAEWDNLTGAKNAMGGQLFVDPATMADLGDKIQGSKDKIGEYTWKIAENREEQAGFAQDAADAAQEIAGAKAEIDQAKNSQEWYTEAVREHEESLARMSERVATAAERVADIGDRLAKNRGAFADASDDTAGLAKAMADAQGDVDEFGTAVYGTPERLSPFQEALRRTQERAADLQTEIGTARGRLVEIRTEIGENETAQGRYQQKIADSIGTLQEYDRKLAGTMLEIQKFRDAGLDYVKQSAPFEDAQKRQADAVERARDAYGDAVDRLADLKQSRADEVSNLATYRSEYAETERAVAGYRKELERVNEQIAILNANPPNPQGALWAGLPDTSGVDLNKPGYANQTGGIEDSADKTLWNEFLAWKDRQFYQGGSAANDSGLTGALEAGVGVASIGADIGLYQYMKNRLPGAGKTVTDAAEVVATGADDVAVASAKGSGILSRIGGALSGLTKFLSPLAVLEGLYTVGAIENAGMDTSKMMDTASGLSFDQINELTAGASPASSDEAARWQQFLAAHPDVKVNVDTTANAPTGDGADVLGWLQGLLPWSAASAAEIVPLDATLDPTITGGAETTAAIDAEVLRGVQAAEATGSTVNENATIAALLTNPDWYLALEEQAGPGIAALKTFMAQEIAAAMSPPINPYGTIDDGSYLGDPRHHESVNPGTAGVEWMPGYGPEGYIGGYQSPSTYDPGAYAGPTRQDMSGEPVFSGDPSNAGDVAAYQLAYSRWLATKGSGTGATADTVAAPAPLPEAASSTEIALKELMAVFGGAGGSVGGTQPIAIQLQSDIPFVAKQITALNADSRYRAGIRTHT